MNENILVISGISGSGKTTLANKLFSYLSNEDRNVVILDGDKVRTFFEGELRYSSKERLTVSKILVHGAHLLSNNGIYVILATMFSQPGAREFAKKNINFTEIFLDAPYEKCVENDSKGIYQKNFANKEPNIVGHDLKIEKPETPALVITTHVESPEESFDKLVNFLKKTNSFGF